MCHNLRRGESRKRAPGGSKLTLGEWSHIQEIDYERIPFKCNFCHVYGHSVKSYPKLAESQKTTTLPAPKDTKFQTVINRRQPPQRKEPQASQHKGSSQDLTPLVESPLPENKNNFEVWQELKDL